MEKDLYDKLTEESKKETGKRSAKKIIVAVVLLIVVVGIIGFAYYSGIFSSIFGEKIASAEEASDTLSGLNNEITGITNDLKDIENKL